MSHTTNPKLILTPSIQVRLIQRNLSLWKSTLHRIPVNTGHANVEPRYHQPECDVENVIIGVKGQGTQSDLNALYEVWHPGLS